MAKATISVDVEFFASLREKAGAKGGKLSFPQGSSLQNLFDFLGEKYPSAFAGDPKGYIFVVNGVKVHPYKVLELHKNDKIDVFPLVGGG